MKMPKLILHSDQSHETTGELDAKLLVSLTGKRLPCIGYIPSVSDSRRKYFSEKERYYKKLGFSSLKYFDPDETNSEEEVHAFFECDVIHLSGGDVCPFMQRLRRTGCDRRLIEFANRGGVILGVSAGAMILGKTFLSASLFGEKGSFDGLGLFDFEIVPHVSEHFPRFDLLRSFAVKNRKSVYALNDGDVVVVSGAKVKTYGAPQQLVP
jgi:dipeptidase E